MQSDNNLMEKIAEAFDLPIISGETSIWFFRTQSGMYYFDFYVNQYIALGWDLISASLINDKEKKITDKKKEISELYPDEKRPGLIFGQMDTFYNKMRAHDLVVIPDVGGQRIAIGILGDIVSEVKHIPQENNYETCKYKHKRSVTWIKRVDLWTDVYLFRVLRAQQTISDITEYSEMVYRNLHPCYIFEDGLHLTLQKKTNTTYHAKDNIDLQSSILDINSKLSHYYGVPDNSAEIIVKTAVGSPGFMEIILPYIPTSALTAVCVIRAIIGKATSDNGKTNTGIMAILTKGNELLNDYTIRKKTAAEIKKIAADTEKTQAETAYIQAQTRKTNADAQATEIANERALAEYIAEKTKVIRTAATQSGVSLDKKIEEVS